jgi:hypothetical protein
MVQADKAEDDANYCVVSMSKDTFIWKGCLDDGTAAVFKLYYGRGPISWLREHLFRFRVQREYDTLTHLFEKGVPCNRLVYWSKGTSSNYGNRHERRTS